MAVDYWQGLSLDPRTWVEPAAAAPAPASAADRRRLLLSCLLSAAVLAAGGVAARLSRPSVPVEVAASRPIKRTVVLAGADELAGALAANGVEPAAAAQAAAAAQSGLVPTGEIKAAVTLFAEPAGPRLERLELSNPDGSGIVVARAGAGFTGERVTADLSTRTVVRRGVMDGESFYSSAVAAGINDSLIPEFARALSFDFDFQRDVHRGDAFEAAFEQAVDKAGAPIGAPRLLYASLTGASRRAAVYRFAGADGQDGWFDANGRSNKRALMRTPVDGARVSSTFGFRIHPVLGFHKFHKGVDFAAAVGTPVFAAGSGVIESAVPSDSAGNWVRLRHDNGWETVYMHLDRFAPGIAGHGARVAQGQQIGAVGTTGRSTGPHLHYELHVGGEAVDPAKVEVAAGTTLSGAARTAFERARDRIDVSRAGQL